MGVTTAWILKLTEHLRVAVGELQMLHLVDNPMLEDTQDDMSCCRGLLHWQGETLEVMDITAWLYNRTAQSETKLVGIFTYLDPANSTTRFAALAIDSIPARKLIHDNQACTLPDALSELTAYSLACFSDAGHAIPVLNLNAIFTAMGLAMDAASLGNDKQANALQTCTDVTKESSLLPPNENSLNVN